MTDNLTPQEIFWSKKIGQAYMEHNKFEPEERIIQRSTFFDLFNFLNKDTKILECGCNLGTNLAILKERGFNNLHGIEIFEGAANEARKNIPTSQITTGTMLNLPYKDNEFDVVFTKDIVWGFKLGNCF